MAFAERLHHVNLRLIRHENGYREDGIFSTLLKDDGTDEQVSVTLEHAYACDDEQVSNDSALAYQHEYVPKITPGAHICKRGKHRLHGMVEDFETFEITGVPGHSKLLFHWGNWTENSDGCVLNGDSEVEGDHAGRHHVGMVTNSRAAFARFMALQAGVDSFTLTVEA